MVTLSDPDKYKFTGFEISTTCGKKYDALMQHKQTGKVKRVPFGDLRYEHFNDRALGLFSHLNHNDPERRRLYKKRHAGENEKKYTAGYFAWRFLW